MLRKKTLVCSPMINSTVPEGKYIRPINPIRLPRFSADLSPSLSVITETLNTVVFAKDPQPRGNLRSLVTPLSTDTKAKAVNQRRAGRERGGGGGADENESSGEWQGEKGAAQSKWATQKPKQRSGAQRCPIGQARETHCRRL